MWMSMHSGADVEAFMAALNRDIGGDMDTIPGPSDSDTDGISQEGAPRQNEVGEMRETSGQNPTLKNQQIEQGKGISDQNKMVGGNPDASTKLPSSQTQTQTRLKMTNPQAQGVNPVSASKKIEKAAVAPTIPFHLLMPILRPHLDKDKDMHLQQIFARLRSNEVSKEDFLRVIRNIVGDKMLRQAAHTVHLQMQAQATKPATSPNTNSSTSTGATSNSNPSPAPSTNPNQYSLPSQATTQQFYPGGFQTTQKVSLGQSPPSPAQLQTESKLEPKGPQSMPNRPSLVSPSMQQLTQPPHQHGPQGAHTTIGMFGPSFPRPGNATPSLRTATSQSQGMGPGQVGQHNWRNVGTTSGPAYVKHKQPETAAVGTLQQKQTMGAGPAPTTDEFLGKLLPQRIGPGPGTGITGPPGQVSATGHQMSRAENMPAASSGPHHPLSGLTKAPSKKPSVGQKKPAEACTSPPTSKKQKTGGAFLDQSIEQLNDVTAVSEVNLRVMSQSKSQNLDVSVESESGPIVARRRNSRLKSEAWNHFDKLETKVVCKHCSMEFATGPNLGTTHLRHHIKDVCDKISEEERGKFGLGKNGDMFGTSNYKFNPEVTRSLMTLLFIDAEIPFSVIESRFWEATMRSLRPDYKAVGRQTLRNDCVEVFNKGLAVSLKEFEELDSCVSFTADIWTSSVNLGYLCLTAHYIDKNFNFQKKIIGFRQMSYPHSGPAVASLIEKILVEWKLDCKIFTVTLDNCAVNDNAIESIEEKFGHQSVFGGKHMHMRCVVHILNIMVQDGMKVIQSALKKIRDIMRQIGSSGKRLQFFNDILKELQLGVKKGVTLDCPTRWNSTYEMVKEALKYKDALFRFGDSSLMDVPSSDEWKEAEELVNFLEVFFDATKTFSTVRQPSSHLYMKEVWTIRAMLLEDYMSFNQTLQILAQKMQPKFNKYWENPNLILILACVFDPRSKLEDVEFFFRVAYGDETDEYNKRLEDVRSLLKKCYDEYASMYNVDRATSSGSPQVENSSLGKRKFDMKLFEFKFEKRHMRPRRSELDNYLEESVVELDEENFDILQWWKRNSDLYPTLAKMARDFLAVQVSTVASESTFSAAGRLTDHSRNSMNAETIEALICSKDWFNSIDGGFDLNQFCPFMRHDREKRWYNFDDRCVSVVQEDNIKTAAAYVLFYRHVDP